MMRIFGVLLVVAVVIGFAFGAQAQNGSNVLVLDVYSVKVPSDVVQEKGFALWAKSLKYCRRWSRGSAKGCKQW
jgi:hypothetical protein